MEMLPNADKAVIPLEKFTDYVLNPNKDPNKAFAFQSALGYSVGNAGLLIENIRVNLRKFPTLVNGHNGYGSRYECIMSIMGANGKKANVLTAWIVIDGEDFPRLTNAYVTKKKLR